LKIIFNKIKGAKGRFVALLKEEAKEERKEKKKDPTELTQEAKSILNFS